MRSDFNDSQSLKLQIISNKMVVKRCKNLKTHQFLNFFSLIRFSSYLNVFAGASKSKFDRIKLTWKFESYIKRTKLFSCFKGRIPSIFSHAFIDLELPTSKEKSSKPLLAYSQIFCFIRTGKENQCSKFFIFDLRPALLKQAW